MPHRESATTAGKLKNRTSNLYPLKLINDIEVLMSHVADLDHFKAWATKIRECLDDRVLTRAGYDFVDCFVFMKRFFKAYGGLQDEDVFAAAVDLAYECVTLNPVCIANMGVVQRDMVYSLQSAPDKTRTTTENKDWLIETGRFISKSTMHRNLNQLVERGLIIKLKHGEYSMMRKDANKDDSVETPFDGLLDDLA